MKSKDAHFMDNKERVLRVLDDALTLLKPIQNKDDPAIDGALIYIEMAMETLKSWDEGEE